MFLVRCRDCGSRLLQPVEIVGPVFGESLVVRSCPECGRTDIVMARDEAVVTWLRRDACIRYRMGELADRLATVSAREVAVASSAAGSSGS